MYSCNAKLTEFKFISAFFCLEDLIWPWKVITPIEESNENQEELEIKIVESTVNTIKEEEIVEQKEVKDSKNPNVSDEGAQQITLDLWLNR